MWKRIQYDQWVDVVPVIAFVLTFSVFVILVTRAILLRQSEARRLAALPLEDGSGLRPDSATPSPDPSHE